MLCAGCYAFGDPVLHGRHRRILDLEQRHVVCLVDAVERRPGALYRRAEHARGRFQGRLLASDRLGLVGRLVGVDVRSAGDLPRAQVVVVWLASGRRIELFDVALGVELDERRRVVGADERRERRRRDQPFADRRRRGTTADGQEPVEGMRERLDRVDVGVDAEGGLRVAGPDQLLRRQTAQQRRAVGLDGFAACVKIS